MKYKKMRTKKHSFFLIILFVSLLLISCDSRKLLDEKMLWVDLVDKKIDKTSTNRTNDIYKIYDPELNSYAEFHLDNNSEYYSSIYWSAGNKIVVHRKHYLTDKGDIYKYSDIYLPDDIDILNTEQVWIKILSRKKYYHDSGKTGYYFYVVEALDTSTNNTCSFLVDSYIYDKMELKETYLANKYYKKYGEMDFVDYSLITKNDL